MVCEMVIKFSPINSSSLKKEESTTKCPVCGSIEIIEDFSIDNTRYNQCLKCYFCYDPYQERGE